MSKRCLGCMEFYGEEFEICPHCGYIEGTPPEEAIHMEPGTILHDRYIVGRVLGFGGFGVTYLGWDGRLEQKVAIKEYLPSEFSTRMPGQSTVTVFNGEKQEQFQDGLSKFVDEAKRLGKFQNEPGIVRIFDSFTDNDTAYIIMEYLDGETLTERLKREHTIPEDEAVEMLWPVMKSLQAVHREGILHRDIAPDNIFLTKDGEVKLIDFGASRYATTSHSRSLTVIIKPGYSPEEQYRSRGDQGTYTDVYAIAATLYKMITGVTPPDAMERRASIENKKKELLENPHKLDKRITINRENAILNAMNVQIEDRTPDIQTFMEELNADPPAKRKYGKIKKIDLYQWPLWMKILVPGILGVVIIFGVLLATGVINIGSLFSGKVEVPEGMVIAPDVEGMDKDEAVTEIESVNLFALANGNVESEYVEAGKIVLQTPVGGSYIDEYGTITLTVSSGKGVKKAENGISTVPYVIWDTKEDAIKKLKKAGLSEPEIEEKYDESVEKGRVISQSEKQGTEVKEGTKITLVISKGPEPFSIPDVTGEDAEEANKLLSEKGLKVSVEYEESSSVPKGKVISQSVSEGTKVQKGDKITLTISKGSDSESSADSGNSSGSDNAKVIVPDVVGKSKSAAVSALEDKGFDVDVEEEYDSDVKKGYVISQSPDGDTKQTKGSTVTIYVSKGTKQSSKSRGVEVPDVIGKSVDSALSDIENSGLSAKVVEEYNSGTQKGVVFSQSPIAFSTVNADSSVKIYVSMGSGEYVTSTSKPSKGTYVADSLSTYSEYRYRDLIRKQSYDTSMSGYTRDDYELVLSDSGSVDYVKSWPSGFDRGHWLYGQYNRSPVLEGETSKTKTVVNTDTVGYIYWHWCRGDHAGAINRFIQNHALSNGDGSFYSFHAALRSSVISSTKWYEGELCYQWASPSDCDSTYWWYGGDLYSSDQLTVYRCNYSKYNKLYSYHKWGDWSDWSSSEAYSGTERDVESRTIYRYIPK